MPGAAVRALAIALVIALACTPSSTANPGAATGTIRTFERASPLELSAAISVRATKVPDEFRYLSGAESADIARIWLADLSTGSVIDVVATRAGHLPIPFSASADGKTLAVGTLAPSGRGAVYVVDVALGTAALRYEDPEGQAAPVPALSADGSRLAFAGSDGIHMLDLRARTQLRFVPHPDVHAASGTWRAVAWSTDGAWLVVARGAESFTELAIVDAGNETRVLGAGVMASWRAKAPELVAMDTITLFGGQSASYLYDVAANRGTPLETKGSQRRASLAWHPNGDRFLYLAAPAGSPLGDIYVRAPNDQVAAKVSAPRSVIDGWWSRDGSKIYGLLIRQDALRDAIGAANYEIAELPAGRIVTIVCRGDPRAACP